MKTFIVNLGSSNVLLNTDTEELETHVGNVDACVKGFFNDTVQNGDGDALEVHSELYINADLLKEYFTDVTGVEATGVEARVMVGFDGIKYVMITPTNIG